MAVKSIKKILVPLDGSKTSLRGLNIAISLAKSLNATITGLHVVRISRNYEIPVSSEIRKKYHKKAEQIINDAMHRVKRDGIEFKGKIKQGSNIGREITKFAQEKRIDLIIIGSRGPDPGAEIFLGSVANYILHKSKIPVTVVK